MNLTEAEEIKNRWPKYIEELYNKGLNDLGNQKSIVTKLEANIMEY